jgi:hypothetical protein
VIEHPDFVPDELKRRPDLRLGDDRGRIWRIVPKVGRSGPERPASGTKPAFSKSASDELVPLLAHPNAWQRETAQRLLLEQQYKTHADKIEAVATNDAEATARLHAAWTLAGIGATPSQYLPSKISATKDPGMVRRHALLLAEEFPRGEFSLYLSGRFFDPDPTMMFQLLMSLPVIDREYARLIAREDHRARHAAIVKACDDPWVRNAALLHFGIEFAPAIVHSLLTTNFQESLRRPDSGMFPLLESFAELTQASEPDAKRRSIESAVTIGATASRDGAKASQRPCTTRVVVSCAP